MIKRFRQGRWDELAGWQFHMLSPGFTIYFAVKKFLRDHAQDVAGNLAYTTVLSLVPLLSVVISALAVFGVFDEDGSSLRSFLEQAFPASAANAAEYLHEFAQTSATSVGGISIVAFVVVGIFLFVAIEKAFNMMWSAPEERPWFSKLLTFYFVITFGPVLLTLSVGISAQAHLVLSRMGVETNLRMALPFLLTFALFTLMNRLLPNTRVWWSAAIVGGLFTSVAFELGKWGFNIYVNEVVFESYRTIYGALGLFPVFMLWVYISWIIVLLGGELSYSVQHLRVLVDVEEADRQRPKKQNPFIFNPLVGLEVLAPIARDFKNAAGPTSETALIRQLGYTEKFLRGVVDELRKLGAVETVEEGEGGERRHIPAKQLDDIALFPIAEHFFEYSDANSHPMDELQRAYRESTRDKLRGKTALALVAPNHELMRDISRFTETHESAWASTPQTPEDPMPEPFPGDLGLDDGEEELGREPSVQVDEEALHSENSEGAHEPEPAPSSRREEPTVPSPGPTDHSEEAIEVTEGLVVESSDVFEDASTETDDDVDISFELDLGEDWEDFDISDAYDDVLSLDDPELRETAEVEMSEAEMASLKEILPPRLPSGETDADSND